MTKIEWTDVTWNPVTGCSKVSEGCRNCYAERLSHRFGWTKKPWTGPNAGENLKLHPERMEQPLRWKKPRRVFVNSMSDLFHEEVPFEFIQDVFDVMVKAWWHTFQILTKRPERMKNFMERFMAQRREYAETLKDNEIRRQAREWAAHPPKNIWLGVSVENQKAADERIPYLLETPAAVRFLSCEPLLGPVDLSGYKPFDGECFCQERVDGCKPRLAKGCPETAIDWVIVGGESGPGARPMHPDWVRSLRDQCQQAGVPFFFKQWGGKKKAGRLLDGEEWNELPRR